jgi:hypothetical protein
LSLDWYGGLAHPIKLDTSGPFRVTPALDMTNSRKSAAYYEMAKLEIPGNARKEVVPKEDLNNKVHMWFKMAIFCAICYKAITTK